MHDDGTLYYAHYTPQLHYRGIALDDDGNMMNECWPWPPISVPLLQDRVAQINPTVLITGWDNVHYMYTDNMTTTLYSVLCTCLSLARQPTKSVTQDLTPIHTTSEDVCPLTASIIVAWSGAVSSE